MDEMDLYRHVFFHRLMSGLIGQEIKVYLPRERQFQKIQFRKEHESEIVENNVKSYYMVFEGKTSRVSGKKVKMVILKGYFLMHRNPVDLSVLNAILDKETKNISEHKYVILLIASPIGFTDEVVKSFGEAEGLRRFDSVYLTIYLIDLRNNRIIFNKDSIASSHNDVIVDKLLLSEKVKRVIDFLRSKEAFAMAHSNNDREPHLLYEEVRKKTREAKEIIEEAFRLLEEMGCGYVERSGGTVAFYYNTENTDCFLIFSDLPIV